MEEAQQSTVKEKKTLTLNDIKTHILEHWGFYAIVIAAILTGIAVSEGYYHVKCERAFNEAISALPPCSTTRYW
jgi:hypothetical protein